MRRKRKEKGERRKGKGKGERGKGKGERGKENRKRRKKEGERRKEKREGRKEGRRKEGRLVGGKTSIITKKKEIPRHVKACSSKCVCGPVKRATNKGAKGRSCVTSLKKKKKKKKKN